MLLVIKKNNGRVNPAPTKWQIATVTKKKKRKKRKPLTDPAEVYLSHAGMLGLGERIYIVWRWNQIILCFTCVPCLPVPGVGMPLLLDVCHSRFDSLS